MSIEIRALKRKDRKTLGKLIIKFVKKTDSDKQTLINLIPPSEDSTESDLDNDESRTAKIVSFAFSLIEGFIQFIEDDVTAWFMDLANVKTIEEYDNLGFDVEAQILDKLIDDPGFISFFSKGLQVRRKIQNLANPQ